MKAATLTRKEAKEKVIWDDISLKVWLNSKGFDTMKPISRRIEKETGDVIFEQEEDNAR